MFSPCGLIISIFCFIAFLSVQLVSRVTATDDVYTPANSTLINCGSSISVTVYGRIWGPDTSADNWLSTSGPHILASNDNISLTANPVSSLLTTARIFTNFSSYTFTVTPSRFWIRLYFYPFQYQQYDLNTAAFSVTANDFTLLYDANVLSKMQKKNSSYLFKEYSVNVSSSTLTLSFYPNTNSYAFINAIEIVSMPSDVLADDAITLENAFLPSMPLETTAGECLYRINAGGPAVTPNNDSSSLYRTWLSNETNLYTTADVNISYLTVDIKTIIPNLFSHIAPPIVYSTAIQMGNAQTADNSLNISWAFNVDPEFVYYIRLHFCEIQGTNDGVGSRVFNVYLQNQTALNNFDIYYLTRGLYNSIYRDISLNTTGGISTISLQMSGKGIMNGIEVWKLNNSVGSLDGKAIHGGSGSESKSNMHAIIGGAVGGFVVMLIIISLASFFLCRRKNKVHKYSPAAGLPRTVHGGNSHTMASKGGTGSYVLSVPSNLGRQFSLSEIEDFTNKFDESRVLGIGGFGKVYKGVTDEGTSVAVKRGNPGSQQGIDEFMTEIEILSKLRHKHLVSLIGYCDENNEMILVYEYMANGSLRSHLYGSDLNPLTWKQRLDICIGAARGLHYLHTGAVQAIIHRDVKTTNILLDENFVAKVSDFGLSKTGPTLYRTHVSTAVKGSIGYLDPEYFRRQQLTEKSDVYSFGVVLMEVLCARPPINPALPQDQVNIVEWAMHWQKMGLLDRLVDPLIEGTIHSNSLRKFGETAEKCLAEQGIDRPTMGDVLWSLEHALQLQEDALSATAEDSNPNQVLQVPIGIPARGHWATIAAEDSMTGVATEEDSEDVSASALFSQLVKPRGR